MTDLPITVIDQIVRQQEEIENLRAEYACAKSFHDVAVQQRNLAWLESERLQKELEEIRQKPLEVNVREKDGWVFMFFGWLSVGIPEFAAIPMEHIMDEYDAFKEYHTK